MSNRYENLGNLLSRKIEDELVSESKSTEKGPETTENEAISVQKDNLPEENSENEISIQNNHLPEEQSSEKQRVSLKDLLPQNEIPVGEILQPDQFTEDVPVKLIRAEVSFPEKRTIN